MSRDLVADVKRQQTQRGFSYDLDAQPLRDVNKATLILIHLASHSVHSVKQNISNNDKPKAYTTNQC